ncbi:hypothetical protein QUA79_28715 [Microcoleus sp. F8-D1]
MVRRDLIYWFTGFTRYFRWSESNAQQGKASLEFNFRSASALPVGIGSQAPAIEPVN